MESSVWKRKVNVFLLGIPVVLFRDQFGLELGILTFVLAALSLIPLAGFLESAVEELAELLGPFVGGLLHTTASNVAELAIAVSILLAFIQKDQPEAGAEIVLGSIAGVIIRNSLLFLGIATLLGCLRNGRMRFSAENASEYSTIFALAVFGLSLPTLAHYVFGSGDAPIGLSVAGQFIPLSLALAGVLFAIYLSYILFVVFHFREGYDLVELGQMRREQRRREVLLRRMERARRRGTALTQPTQPDTQALFSEEREHARGELERAAQLRAVETAEKIAERQHASVAVKQRLHARALQLQEKREAQREAGERGFLAGHPLLRGLAAVVVLAIATAGVAAMSEGFAGSVEEVLRSYHLTSLEFFIGLVLIPVLGGVVELYGSVGMARRNRMEITMAVTAGASIQMILLVVPILVVVSIALGHPLDLVFKPLEVIIFGAATFAYMLLSRDGESTLMEGAQLCALWLLLAITAFFLPPV